MELNVTWSYKTTHTFEFNSLVYLIIFEHCQYRVWTDSKTKIWYWERIRVTMKKKDCKKWDIADISTMHFIVNRTVFKKPSQTSTHLSSNSCVISLITPDNPFTMSMFVSKLVRFDNSTDLTRRSITFCHNCSLKMSVLDLMLLQTTFCRQEQMVTASSRAELSVQSGMIKFCINVDQIKSVIAILPFKMWINSHFAVLLLTFCPLI